MTIKGLRRDIHIFNTLAQENGITQEDLANIVRNIDGLDKVPYLERESSVEDFLEFFGFGTPEQLVQNYYTQAQNYVQNKLPQKQWETLVEELYARSSHLSYCSLDALTAHIYKT